MKIALGADHAAYEFKNSVKAYLESLGHEVEDFGTFSSESVDYADYGIAVGEAVASGRCERGVVCCGSGIGISIACNKVRGIRCALCLDAQMAELSRRHNDANVLAMGARLISFEKGREILDVWLSTPFEAGRHQRRIDKISLYESR